MGTTLEQSNRAADRSSTLDQSLSPSETRAGGTVKPRGLASAYAATIGAVLATLDLDGHDIDPRHVEAWMRLEHGTLDALTPDQFRREVQIAVDCIVAGPRWQSESLAESYGL